MCAAQVVALNCPEAIRYNAWNRSRVRACAAEIGSRAACEQRERERSPIHALIVPRDGFVRARWHTE